MQRVNAESEEMNDDDTGGGNTDERTHDHGAGGAAGTAGPSTATTGWWCHQCQKLVEPIEEQEEPLCRECESGFVEVVNIPPARLSWSSGALPAQYPTGGLFVTSLSDSDALTMEGFDFVPMSPEDGAGGMHTTGNIWHTADGSQFSGSSPPRAAATSESFGTSAPPVNDFDRWFRQIFQSFLGHQPATHHPPHPVLEPWGNSFFVTMSGTSAGDTAGSPHWTVQTTGGEPMNVPNGFQNFMQAFGQGMNLFNDDAFQNVLQFIMDNDPNRHGSPPAAQRVLDAMSVETLTADTAVGDCAICQEVFQADDLVYRLKDTAALFLEEDEWLPAEGIPPASDNSAEAGSGSSCSCTHMFHIDCILPWLRQHNSCPVCRYEFPTDDAEYERQKSELRRRLRSEASRLREHQRRTSN